MESSKTSTLEDKKQNFYEEKTDIKFEKLQNKSNVNQNTNSLVNLNNPKNDIKFSKTVGISTASPDSGKTNENIINIENLKKNEIPSIEKINSFNSNSSNLSQVLNNCIEKIGQIELKR